MVRSRVDFCGLEREDDFCPLAGLAADLEGDRMPVRDTLHDRQTQSGTFFFCIFRTEEFFKYREAQQTKVDAAVADTASKAYPV